MIFDPQLYIQILAHPNFPWNSLTPEGIIPVKAKSIVQQRLDEGSQEEAAFMTGLIIGCTKNRGFSESVADSSLSPSAGLAKVFTEHTSSVQLERLVHDEPAAASLAACHPNGCGIEIKSLPSAKRKFVRNLRGRSNVTIKLSGRTAKTTFVVDPDAFVL